MNRLLYKFQKRFMRTSANDINYDTMLEMIRNNKNIVVFDVRTKDEFEYNHLKGAINLPLQDISEKSVERYVKNKSNVIIVYCEYGGRSKKAMNKLIKMGYLNVYNLDGGIENV